MRANCGICPYEDALTELTVRSLLQALCFYQVKPRNCQVELEFRLGCYTPTAHIGLGSFLPVTFETPAILNPHAKRAYRFRSGVDRLLATQIEEALLRSKLARPSELQSVRENIIVRTLSGHRHLFRCEHDGASGRGDSGASSASPLVAISHSSPGVLCGDTRHFQLASLQTSVAKMTSRAEEVCCPRWNSDVRLALAFEQELTRAVDTRRMHANTDDDVGKRNNDTNNTTRIDMDSRSASTHHDCTLCTMSPTLSSPATSTVTSQAKEEGGESKIASSTHLDPCIHTVASATTTTTAAAAAAAAAQAHRAPDDTHSYTREHTRHAQHYHDVFGTDTAPFVIQAIVRQQRKSIALHHFFHTHLSCCSDLHDISLCSFDWPGGQVCVPKKRVSWAAPVYHAEVEVDLARLLTEWRRTTGGRRVLRRLGAREGVAGERSEQQPPPPGCIRALSNEQEHRQVADGYDSNQSHAKNVCSKQSAAARSSDTNGGAESESRGNNFDCVDGKAAAGTPVWMQDEQIIMDEYVGDDSLCAKHPLLRSVAQDLLAVVQFLATR